MTNLKVEGPPVSARYGEAVAALGSERFEAVRSAKILVVGAGGIGCELLKNLVLLGAEQLVAIDLDTIDISNLNRQFLFRKRHVGMSKAEVARDACREFNGAAHIEAFKANVKEGRFGVSWVGQFDVVINALDNVDARRHVNRTCLAANVPLVEAGTTGYLGQVFSIFKGVTSCYECFPKAAQKVYPVCTIRSTPDKPVHCIVWAKELLKLAFGVAAESMLFDDAGADDSDAAAASEEEKNNNGSSHGAGTNGEKKTIEKAVYADAVAALRTTERSAADAAVALFELEMKRQISLNEAVEEQKDAAPTSVRRAALDPAMLRAAIQDVAPPSAKKATADWDRKAWSVEESAAEFALACEALRKRQAPTIAFDKDDDDTMRFVAAAANLRSANYSIPLLSLHDAKGIAGNIIPAIATTNAIIAGLQVSQLVKILTLKLEKRLEDVPKVLKYVDCLRLPNGRGQLVAASALDEPQASCYVCRSAVVDVGLDLATTTLQRFVDAVLVSHFNFTEPAVDVGDSGVYDPDDDRLDANKSLPLASIANVHAGAMLKATDYATDLELTVVLHQRSKLELLQARKDPQDGPPLFLLLSADDIQKNHAASGTDADDDNNNGHAAATPVAANKRSREDDNDDDVPVVLDDGGVVDEAPPASKRAKNN